MSAVTLFGQPFFEVRSPEGPVLVGAKIRVYLAGTSTPAVVYHNPDLTGAWSQPIVTNAAGQSGGPVYVSPTSSLKIDVVDANDVQVDGYPMDGWTPPAIATV